MNSLLRSIFLLLLCIPLQDLAGQPRHRAIQGAVYTAHHGRALEGVHLRLYQPDRTTLVAETVTNEIGLFFLTNLNPGSYMLEAMHIGYNLDTRSIYLSPDADSFSIQSVVIPLRSATSDLHFVTGSPTREPTLLEQQPSSTIIQDGLRLQRAAGLSPIWAFRYQPGFYVAQSNPSAEQFSIRGGRTSFNGSTHIRIDGLPWDIPAAGYSLFSLMPLHPLDLDRAEMTRGEQAIFYGGGAERGALQFSSRDPFVYPGLSVLTEGGNRDQLHLGFRYANQAGKQLGYKITGQFRGSDEWKLDPFQSDEEARLAASEGRPRIDELTAYQLNTSLYFKTDQNVLLVARGGLQSLTAPLATPVGITNYEDFKIVHGALSLDAGAVAADFSIRQNNSGSSYYAGNGMLGPEARDLSDTSSEIYSGVRFTQQLGFRAFSLKAGAEFRFTTPRTNNTLHEVLEQEDAFSELGAYAHMDGALTPRLFLASGMRLIVYDTDNTARLAPAAGLVYALSENHRLKASFAIGWSRPNLFTHHLSTVLSRSPATGPFAEVVRGIGGQEQHTFDEFSASNTFTFLLPDAFDRQNPQNPVTFGGRVPLNEVPLSPVYDYFVTAFQEALNTGEPLPLQLADVSPADLSAFAEVLNQLKPFIQGATPGSVTLPVGSLVTDQATPLSPLRPSSSRSFEFGYQGRIFNAWSARLELFQIKQRDIISSLEPLTPHVYLATLEADLARTLSPELQEFLRARPEAAALLERMNLNATEAAQLIGRLAHTGLGERAGLRETPVGVVQSDQQLENGPASPTTVTSLRAFRNIGEASYWGINALLTYSHSAGSSFFISLANLSEAAPLLQATTPGNINRSFHLNAPTLTLALGTELYLARGLSLQAAGRFVDAYPYVYGNFNTVIQQYVVLDGGISYDASTYFPGLQVGIFGQNLTLYQKDNPGALLYELPGFAGQGRLIRARIIYTF